MCATGIYATLLSMADTHTQTLRLPIDLRKAVDRYWHQNELPSRHAAILELIDLALPASARLVDRQARDPGA